MDANRGPDHYRVLPEPIPVSEMTTGHDVSAVGRAAGLAAAAALSAPGVPLGPEGE